ncbi:hypothetical protein ACFYO2_43490 [Streptomyces sp. NPDC006602]|uniref:hypothetical protein n=1 Tax=Streptomyces sp. NPDC006602 TaxID=3364751 RepID=UPI0036791401
MKRRTFLGATTASLAAAQLAGPAHATSPTAGPTAGQYTVVARFWGSMPTGVTVSRHGRIFVNFPRWGDDVPFTVAELRHGKPVAYPNAEVNREDASDLAGHFQSVQSIVVDPADRLWILDTGNPLYRRLGPAPVRHRQPAQPDVALPRGRGSAPQALSPGPPADRRRAGQARVTSPARVT